MKKKIAFATNEKYANLIPDDQLAADELGKLGIEVLPAIWTQPQDWSRFDAVIIRSPWGYQRQFEQFLNWFDELDKSGVPVWNPVAMLRWNINKLYLKELAAQGVPVVPTLWMDPNDHAKLKEISDGKVWKGADEFVVKPVVSAGAASTYRLRTTEAVSSVSKFEESWKFGPAMVQPFLNSVVEEGEYSFIIFGGELSHVVLKKAASGDFRVQRDHGGTSHLVQVSQQWVDIAQNVVKKLSPVPLYARVDMVNNEGQLQLMELEVLEPALFFAEHPGAPAMFARKVRDLLSK